MQIEYYTISLFQFTVLNSSHKMYLNIYLLINILLCTTQVHSYRILCAFTTSSRSHFIVVDGLMRGLAANGHNVTVASAFPPRRNIENYRHIKTDEKVMHEDIIKKFIERPGDIINTFKTLPSFLRASIEEAKDMLNLPEIQQIMLNEQFDLVIMEGFHSDFLYGLGAHFNCPIIEFSTIRTVNYMIEKVGNPTGVSYFPNFYGEYQTPMDFKSRAMNMINYLVERPLFYYYRKCHEAAYNEYFPQPNYPAYDVISKNISAIFITDHFSENSVLPLLPKIVQVGGIHLNDQLDPLPADLQIWMDRSTNGVILFSLGSNLKCSNIKPELLRDILDVFKRIKENILWKCESENSGVSKNVRILNWIPQTAVLQHKNTKLFVTHGGYGSLTEARYYGVPLVMIPFYGDQMANVFRVKHEGFGIIVPYAELNADRMFKAIREAIDNSKFDQMAKYRSKLYRDRPLSALQNGIFWVEYIIRHGGAKHLESNAVNLNFIQLHSLDVIGTFVLMLVISVHTFYKSCKCLASKFKSKTIKVKVK